MLWSLWFASPLRRAPSPRRRVPPAAAILACSPLRRRRLPLLWRGLYRRRQIQASSKSLAPSILPSSLHSRNWVKNIPQSSILTVEAAILERYKNLFFPKKCQKWQGCCCKKPENKLLLSLSFRSMGMKDPCSFHPGDICTQHDLFTWSSMPSFFKLSSYIKLSPLKIWEFWPIFLTKFKES